VTVRHVPVTVKHDECDLTGVLIDYRNDNMRVPPAGQAYGDSVGLVAAVSKNGDVTVKADRNFGGDQ
jgi:hypothetical protein